MLRRFSRLSSLSLSCSSRKRPGSIPEQRPSKCAQGFARGVKADLEGARLTPNFRRGEPPSKVVGRLRLPTTIAEPRILSEFIPRFGAAQQGRSGEFLIRSVRSHLAESRATSRLGLFTIPTPTPLQSSKLIIMCGSRLNEASHGLELVNIFFASQLFPFASEVSSRPTTLIRYLR
jgi:hypothetical protein